MGGQPEGDVFKNRHAVEERGALEEKADAQALLLQKVRGQVVHVPAVEEDFSLGRLHQGNECFQQNGFATPALADDGQGLSAGNIE